jgi:hypothetical protein
MDASFGLLHFLLFEKQLDDVMLFLSFSIPLTICRFILLLLFCSSASIVLTMQ